MDGRAASGNDAGNKWAGRGNEHSYISDVNICLGCDEHCQSLGVVMGSGSPHGSLAILTEHTEGSAASESQTVGDSMVRAAAIISLGCRFRIVEN